MVAVEETGALDLTKGDIALPELYPVRVVVIVAVEDVPGAIPMTVTRPLAPIDTLPEALEVPAKVKAGSKLLI